MLDISGLLRAALTDLGLVLALVFGVGLRIAFVDRIGVGILDRVWVGIGVGVLDGGLGILCWNYSAIDRNQCHCYFFINTSLPEVHRFP